MKDSEQVMIRANNPAIDVVELMKRVRTEAAKIRVSGSIEQRRAGFQDDDDRRTARALDRHHFVSSLLNNAEAKNRPRAEWPRRLRFLRVLEPISHFGLRVWNYLFKEQREKDAEMLHAMREIIAMTAQIGDYALRLRESHRIYERHRLDLTEEMDRLRADVASVHPLTTRLEGLESAHHRTHERSLEAQALAAELDSRLEALNITTATSRIDHAHQRLDVVQRDVAAISARLDAEPQAAYAAARIDHAHERIDIAERDLAAFSARLAGTPTNADVTARIAESEHMQHVVFDRGLTNALRANALVRTDISDIRRLLDAAPATATSSPGGEFATRSFDALYMAIEDRFRGSRYDIETRLSAYVEVLRDNGTITAQQPLLDLGAGRGDFVKVISDAGLPAIGVDSNTVAVAEAALCGLNVTVGDLFDCLHATAAGSVGSVSAIQVIEHLPFPRLVELFEESLRVLVPGGLLIVETPNPLNIRVATSTFYLDPTHRMPVHPQLAVFLAESIGFTNARTKELHPPDDTPPESSSLLDSLLYAGQDYVLIARAPLA
jgi:O-antigen chain-terminating methyltransferase